MLAQPNPKLDNKQAQQVYSGKPSYPAYAVDIQEINLRSGRVLLDKKPLPPPRESEEEREEIMPKVNPPPFPERLTHLVQPTPEENELLGELKNLCVRITLLQVIKDVPIYNKLIKEKCFKHPRRRKRDTPTISVIGQLSDLMLG